MESDILKCAAWKIARFNAIGLHYNLVADQIYEKRKGTDPFDRSFLAYIIAGLLSFNMGRAGMMGGKPYELKGNSFALRLSSKLQVLKPRLKPLINLDLTKINVQQYRKVIIKTYNTLSAKGEGALHEKGKAFPVGATKILHFLNPRLFIIVDSNAAKAFKRAPNLRFKNSTQSGYSGDFYVECMRHAQEDIREYGSENFQALERDVPITRIYDKLTFITGSEKQA